MAREDETEVLVVGAGPVGLLTALLLADKGVPVTVIDREQRVAARSYACVLHPGTMRLLDRLGLAQGILQRGRRVESVSLYDGESRRAELKFPVSSGNFPCAVVIPQSAFETMLEQRLREQYHVQVQWNHRLSNLQAEPDAMVATLDKLVQSAKGYIIPDWDWTVQKTLQNRASFVVGADGHASMVRSRIGIEYEPLGEPELFAVFEFESDRDPGDEVRIVIAGDTSNVMWPLPGRGCRWSFQLVKTREFGQFPDKERETMWAMRTEIDVETRDRVERLARKRAPWFQGNIRDFHWWAHIRLQRTLAKQFGVRRTWLAGDAAHQTGPVGAQSMNAGLLEAADLAERLGNVVSGKAPLDSLEDYGRTHRDKWIKLLGIKGGPQPKNGADPWIKEHASKLISCIPALGDDLAGMANQLGLEF